MFYKHLDEAIVRYKMFVPLVEGFAGGAAMATVGDVANTFELWLEARGDAGLPYFTGVVFGGGSPTRPAVIGVFGWRGDSEFVTIQEGNAVVEFSTHPELHRGLSESDFDEILLSLANHMGEAFRQKRIYVINQTENRLQIFQEQGSRTPTQLD